jgi:hypothetical protein
MDAAPTELVAQRVTATVERDAARLVRIETEHERFVTTPEHPFATPESGWVSAGRLVPGDRVVSAKFGTLKILSVRTENTTRPVPVFNLTVTPSHAYLVGSDQVLVHNVRCKHENTLALLKEKTEELREALRRLEELEATTATSPQHQAALEQQIAELKSSIGKIRKSMEGARARLKKAGIDPGSTQDLDELNEQRRTARKRLTARAHEQRLAGRATKHEQLLRHAEADYESVKKELEGIQSALRELDAQTPLSDAEKETALKRKAELERRLKAQELELASAEQIRTWEREVAEFERAKLTKSEDPGLEQYISDLKTKLATEKDRKSSRIRQRRMREDPEQNVDFREARARAARARLRTKSHLADSERPRDPIERVEEELAALHEQPASAGRDQRITHLTAALQTLKGLTNVRRGEANARAVLHKARTQRKELMDQGKNTTEIDQKITRVMNEQEARKTERAELRAHALLLGMREARRKNPREIDEVRFRAFEQAFADPATVDEQRLGNFERELAEILRDESDTLDAEFFDEIWREAAAEGEAQQETAHGANPAAPARDQSPWRSPSFEPAAAAAEPGFRALQIELRAQRIAFEMEDMELANQHAAQSQALPGPGSSRHAEGVRRLQELEAARLQLRMDWRRLMQDRLDLARQELRTTQSIERFRDEATEADLARQVALLEHEVQNPSF